LCEHLHFSKSSRIRRLALFEQDWWSDFPGESGRFPSVETSQTALAQAKAAVGLFVARKFGLALSAHKVATAFAVKDQGGLCGAKEFSLFLDLFVGQIGVGAAVDANNALALAASGAIAIFGTTLGVALDAVDHPIRVFLVVRIGFATFCRLDRASKFADQLIPVFGLSDVISGTATGFRRDLRRLGVGELAPSRIQDLGGFGRAFAFGFGDRAFHRGASL
jgi:hypothetical protein